MERTAKGKVRSSRLIILFNILFFNTIKILDFASDFFAFTHTLIIFYMDSIVFNIFSPLWNTPMPLKVQRSLKSQSAIQLTCNSATVKKRKGQLAETHSKTWERWVLFQTNRGKQGRLVRHLPLLKGTTCLLLFHLPASPGTLSEDLNVTVYIVITPVPPLPYHPILTLL